MPANPAWPLVACASKPGMPFGGMSANKPSRAIVICTDNSKYLLLISETHIYQCVLMFRAEDVSMSQILGCFFFFFLFIPNDLQYLLHTNYFLNRCESAPLCTLFHHWILLQNVSSLVCHKHYTNFCHLENQIPLIILPFHSVKIFMIRVEWCYAYCLH